jgi:hypothetical protein
MPANTKPDMPSALRTPRIVLAVIGLCALAAACSNAPIDGARDIGNMAYPQPLPAGTLSTTAFSGRQPQGSSGMAYSTPLPKGNGQLALVK